MFHAFRVVWRHLFVYACVCVCLSFMCEGVFLCEKEKGRNCETRTGKVWGETGASLKCDSREQLVDETTCSKSKKKR